MEIVRMDQKTRQYTVYKKPILNIRTHKLKVSEWRKIDPAKTNQKKAVVLGRAFFRTRPVIKDKQGHYIIT